LPRWHHGRRLPHPGWTTRAHTSRTPAARAPRCCRPENPSTTTETAARHPAPAAPPPRSRPRRCAPERAHTHCATPTGPHPGAHSDPDHPDSPPAHPPTAPAPPTGSPSPPAQRQCSTPDPSHRLATPATARERSRTGLPFASACSSRRSTDTRHDRAGHLDLQER